jgi:glutamate racemase
MQNKKEASLGVFDSGVGGLTVVREILKQMPYESVLYYADTAHVPYGSRNPEELKGFAQVITSYLVTQGCKMIIIACNTSTSLAYESLKKSHSLPIIGVIEPGVQKALQTTKNLRIGVIGTEVTINSGAYQKLLRIKNPTVQVYAAACPLFVPLVEKGMIEDPDTEKVVYSCLKPLLAEKIDTLILGCTHYPFLQPVIEKIAGTGVKIVDPARETVTNVRDKLRELKLLAEKKEPVYRYVSSKDPEDFKARGSVFLGRDLGMVRELIL